MENYGKNKVTKKCPGIDKGLIFLISKDSYKTVKKQNKTLNSYSPLGIWEQNTKRQFIKERSIVKRNLNHTKKSNHSIFKIKIRNNNIVDESTNSGTRITEFEDLVLKLNWELWARNLTFLCFSFSPVKWGS